MALTDSKGLTQDKSRNKTKRNKMSTKKLLLATIVGVVLLIVPVILMYVDPISLVVQYKLRLENGSMLHDVLRGRLMSTKMYLYLYNVSNADRFLAGADEKVELQEIGPFVYQEYRMLEDLEINKDPGIMKYTPKLEKVFVPEESIGDPKDINLTVPDIAMLSATALMSKYPYFVRQLYNMITASNHVKAFTHLRAQDHIWGYPHPLLKLANNVVPGLIYFKSVGLLERMYDSDVDIRLELGTRDADRFSVKKATKIQAKDRETDAKALIDNIFSYNDTYEGAAFPIRVTPETPIHIYRHGLCETFHLQYAGTKRMPYGGDGFLYRLHNDTFGDRRLCDSQGWCPAGLKDMSECYFGFPVALSKSHFLDADPRLLDMVKGLKPDRKLHDTEIILDPKIGVGISGSMALQMNLFLGDVSFNPQTRRLKDTVLPVCNIISKAPPLIVEVSSVLQLMYKRGPYLIVAVQVVCALLGLFLLSTSFRTMYWRWLARKKSNEKILTKAQWPLLIS